MTWLVRNPSFGLATAPDWELPEEDEVLAPLATLGATRVGSLAPPPSSAPPVVARSATVGLSGIPLGFSDCLEIPDMSGAPDLTRSPPRRRGRASRAVDLVSLVARPDPRRPTCTKAMPFPHGC